MTQVHFTLSQEEIQSFIEQSISDQFAQSVLTKVFNQLMEHQRDEYIGAKPYERLGDRKSNRNGYYERDYTTRVGTLTLRVPRTRDGQFSPDVFSRYQRHEKSLLASMLELYVQGVSTRKVGHIVEELCGKRPSKSFVSSLTKELDEEVKRWQYAPLNSHSYPYLIVDVVYIKVREDHRVLSKSCHVAIGINEEGNREVLGLLILGGESFETWTRFFDYLKQRGLSGVKLVISDAHKLSLIHISEPTRPY